MPNDSLSSPARGFFSHRPASNWEEGLLCGNGTIGLLALSRTADERIIVTHERHFMPMGAPPVPANQAASLKEIRKLIREGRYQEASQLQFDRSELQRFRYPDFFVPCFDLRLQQPHKGDVIYQGRSVDFASGEAVVRWIDDGIAFDRRMFVSRADGIAVVRLKASAQGAIDVRIKLEPREPCDEYNADSDIRMRSDECFRKHIGMVASHAGKTWLRYEHTFLRPYPGSIRSLDGYARVICQGGHSRAEKDGTLLVSGADEILLMLDVRLSKNERERGSLDIASHLANLPACYETLLQSHEEKHRSIFMRMEFKLDGVPALQKSVEELLDESDLQTLNPALLEKQFDAGRYNILSSSGNLPPNLQGLWAGIYVPGWASDYTHNGNLPAAIAAHHQGNMPELMDSYLTYMESLIPDMECNARHFFGARGIVLPSRTSTHGLNLALAPEFAGGMWIAAAAWAARFFYDHYSFTQDLHYLRTRALPFMEKVVEFFEDFLTEDENGMLVFSPGQSPENTPANSDSQASFNATMDVAAAKELFHHIIEASLELGVNHDKIPRWQQMLARMPEYQVDDRGLIKEWLTPLLQNHDEHRHSSQLYPLYYGMPEEIERHPLWREAFRKTIEWKLDRHWNHDSRGFMSFGLIQLGQAAASLGDGELALRCLKHLSHRFWLPNLASMHNHRSLLNMDISGGLPAVIIQMLVSSRRGHIRLLPALPREWNRGSLSNALCRGGVTLQRLEWNGGDVKIELRSLYTQTIRLSCPFGIQSWETSPNAETTIRRDAATLEITLHAHQSHVVNLSIDRHGHQACNKNLTGNLVGQGSLTLGSGED